MRPEEAVIYFFAGVIFLYFLLSEEEKKIEEEVREELEEIGEEVEVGEVVFLGMGKRKRVKECRVFGKKFICVCSGGVIYEIEGGKVVDGVLVVNDIEINYRDKGVYSVNCAYSVVEEIGREKVERKKWDLLVAKMKKIAKIEEKDYKERRIEM